MMTCRLLCALLVLALCCRPSVFASESETAQVEDIVSGTYSPSLVPGAPQRAIVSESGASLVPKPAAKPEVDGEVQLKSGEDGQGLAGPGPKAIAASNELQGDGEDITTVSQSRTRQPAEEKVESAEGLAKTTKTTKIKSPEGASPGDLPAKATDLTPSPPVEGPLPNADKAPVPQPEEDSVSAKPNKDLAEEDIATTTDTDQIETSGGRAESTTTTTLVASDNANNEADRSTGEDIPNNTPDSDVSGTEERRDENKYNNTKKTPVQVADIKSVTVASGNSDSSTAVSHTSPLLLLLVAAAAAVVAA
ncbi:Mucin-associated surface protein (MASP) [Trypanosoma cruzi]|uniref:Mucin-associated surface protein (MASP), putative n=2 Tax=Trypanosoma cruzi TaxID=5693 RepID=Q4CZB0_TRYCC|nr:mucin-associated surface protein (MASP), putative [Trypanosoma cruzi]EAN85614.1 mucin-associated surface protein (MASP), putative [Trypanosoma cruzi]PWV14092.1 Mucin-associated surface protein (MASP) [Trypanosoma cruzi]|eukprot:XP_807465.1 mucin-associated surface protein (MASP) [Trypanosoma cruzi strain CL Brener]